MKRHFAELAGYNAWANARLYSDASTLPEEAIHRDVGVYFKSLFATLNHILTVDRAWAHLIDGGTLQNLPKPPMIGDFGELSDARGRQDALLIKRIAEVDEAWFDGPIIFQSALPAWRGKIYRGTRSGILTHVFNHQTHHRGQAHTALSLLGFEEPAALDILVMGFVDA